MLGGGVLISLYLTWSPGRFWLRLLFYWLIIGLLVCLYQVGGFGNELFAAILRPAADPYSSFFSDESAFSTTLASLCSLPMLMLMTQLPFWSLRMLLGCRLEKNVGNCQTLNQPLQGFSIFDLMLATALVAGSLSLLQLGYGLIPAVMDYQLAFGLEWYWYRTVYISTFCLLSALFICAPLSFFFLKPFPLWIAWGLTVAVAIVVAWVLLNYEFQPVDRWAPLRESCLTSCAIVGSIGIGLTLLRLSGWRLKTRWSKDGPER
jgi:hypothetical protein